MSAVVQLAKIKDTIKDYPNVRIVAATKYLILIKQKKSLMQELKILEKIVKILF